MQGKIYACGYLYWKHGEELYVCVFLIQHKKMENNITKLVSPQPIFKNEYYQCYRCSLFVFLVPFSTNPTSTPKKSLSSIMFREGDGTPLSTLAWKIPWTEEPGGLQSMGLLKSQTRLSNFTFTFHFHALEKETATHSSVLAWRIPGTGEPGGLPSMGSHRVGYN